MKGIRIVGAVPPFVEICRHFSRTLRTRYVCEDAPCFHGDQLPSDDEWKLIDQQRSIVGRQFIVTPMFIEQFGSRLLVTANCIHVYDFLKNPIQAESIVFKSLKWEWAYHCFDGTVIEVYVRIDHEEAYISLKSAYTCQDIEFPGYIPLGMNILES